MNREKCEELIIEKMKEIDKIYREYNPDGDYIDFCIFSKRGHFSVSNCYYDKDKDHPIHCTWDVGDKKIFRF